MERRKKLVQRIRNLMQQDTSRWSDAAAREFRRFLPDPPNYNYHLVLPTPEHVLTPGYTTREFYAALHLCGVLERMITLEHPKSDE